MELVDLSHLRFHRTFQSLCLPLHFTHGRLSNTICGVLSNWALTQNQLNNWGYQQSRSLESYDGSPSLCNIALRYPCWRNRDTKTDICLNVASKTGTPTTTWHTHSLLFVEDRLKHTFHRWFRRWRTWSITFAFAFAFLVDVIIETAPIFFWSTFLSAIRCLHSCDILSSLLSLSCDFRLMVAAYGAPPFRASKFRSFVT